MRARFLQVLVIKKVQLPKSDAYRKLHPPAMPDIGESLSAYSQASVNITSGYKIINKKL